jgi:hypothetical protein
MILVCLWDVCKEVDVLGYVICLACVFYHVSVCVWLMVQRAIECMDTILCWHVVDV